jgi:hypothetical protein
MKRVYVAFDYEFNRNYKFMLNAWNKNPLFDFVFEDVSSQEIDSYNIGRIKAGLTQKINSATHTLVIVGKYANTPHPKSSLIGEINWINWEIVKSKENGNKLVGVKINREYESPRALLGSNAAWAMSFTEDAIIRALDQA